ncbi:MULTISPECIES: hypothetical protein [Pseudomonas]|uniref:Uncharacterized protein n=1 Tax=Pseudomonas fluorescens TaxID=294 RepID=A0A166QNM2_PSEFL|nr:MULTISPECIES: hypothetical protein [Pseudomonas]KZN20593.1 hypothetical protein A1D17_03375 [Pseudomonas fluorescens]
MAEAESNPVGYPTRLVQITGERVALMFHNCIRVSRFEKALLGLVMSGNSDNRKMAKNATERFNRAITAFEEELKQAERELKASSKPSNPKRQEQSGGSKQVTPSKPAQGAKPAAASQAAPASATAPAAPKPSGTGAAEPKPSKEQGATQPAKQTKPDANAQQSAPATAPAPKAKNPQAGQQKGGNQGNKQPGNGGNNGKPQRQPQSEANKGGAVPDSGSGNPVEASMEPAVVQLAEAPVL